MATAGLIEVQLQPNLDSTMATAQISPGSPIVIERLREPQVQ